MNQLFIDLYLDEDVHVLVGKLINHYGYSAVTTRDVGNLETDDEDQLAYAVEEKRALLTHNRSDFEGLAETYFQSGKEHYGIIIAVRRSPYEIARRILQSQKRHHHLAPNPYYLTSVPTLFARPVSLPVNRRGNASACGVGVVHFGVSIHIYPNILMKTTARVSTFFIVCLLLFSPILVEAGPGQGLAVAPDGTVYFSGISNVYKIDPQGNTTVFVNKNTMELHLDGKYLYGRYHDWPNNRYWRADLNGHVIDVSPEVAAWFFGGVDDAGYVYTLHADRERNWIEKTGLDGEAVVLAGGAKGYADGRGKKARFGGFGTAAWGPDECLYVAGGGMVRRVTPEGMVTTYAGPEQGFEGGRYSMLMAIDFDPQGNLYISDPVQKKIFKMTPEGEVVLLMSSGDWRPTGLTVANGAVYVLEYGSRNAPRVRKIAADGSVTTIGNADGA